jgi:hypothetical protein
MTKKNEEAFAAGVKEVLDAYGVLTAGYAEGLAFYDSLLPVGPYNGGDVKAEIEGITALRSVMVKAGLRNPAKFKSAIARRSAETETLGSVVVLPHATITALEVVGKPPEEEDVEGRPSESSSTDETG